MTHVWFGFIVGEVLPSLALSHAWEKGFLFSLRDSVICRSVGLLFLERNREPSAGPLGWCVEPKGWVAPRYARRAFPVPWPGHERPW